LEFDFGKNWFDFSMNALNAAKVVQAKRDFKALTAGIDIRGKSFLDIGFGQGLSLLTAAEMGAQVVGCEVNPRCPDVLRRNQMRFFAGLRDKNIKFYVGSILDDTSVRDLRGYTVNEDGCYEVVHSWGVLHHTGDMRKGIQNVASLVRKPGYLILALYNRHWSSPFWKYIKWIYCHSPKWMQEALITFFYPVIYSAKWIVTKQNPAEMNRGMDFYYDVVDWVGGYPFEYVSIKEVKTLMTHLGFEMIRMIPARVPTGCNQFVFQRRN
jgi:2-polyprenyl-6-hydroxyphenyl methylase/3-demethylubiquinone-9 3-methyltransferase